MTDMEKVIKGLQYCFATANCDGCPYEIECKRISFKTPEDHCPILDDILALLKEQEPVKPERAYSGGGSTWWNVCGACKTAINPNDKYCHECGRAVKWE